MASTHSPTFREPDFAEFHIRQIVRFHFEQCQIRTRIGTDQLRSELPSIAESNQYLVCLFDHMVVGQDVSAFKHKSGAQRARSRIGLGAALTWWKEPPEELFEFVVPGARPLLVYFGRVADGADVHHRRRIFFNQLREVG